MQRQTYRITQVLRSPFGAPLFSFSPTSWRSEGVSCIFIQFWIYSRIKIDGGNGDATVTGWFHIFVTNWEKNAFEMPLKGAFMARAEFTRTHFESIETMCRLDSYYARSTGHYMPFDEDLSVSTVGDVTIFSSKDRWCALCMDRVIFKLFLWEELICF